MKRNERDGSRAVDTPLRGPNCSANVIAQLSLNPLLHLCFRGLWVKSESLNEVSIQQCDSAWIKSVNCGSVFYRVELPVAESPAIS